MDVGTTSKEKGEKKGSELSKKYSDVKRKIKDTLCLRMPAEFKTYGSFLRW